MTSIQKYRTPYVTSGSVVVIMSSGGGYKELEFPM